MNIFRILGDFYHVLSVFIVLAYIFRAKSCSGLSGKTQLLFALVYTTRYLDLFINFISFYNSIMKIFYVASSYIILYAIFLKYKTKYEKESDTFRIEFLILVVFAVALVFNYDYTLLEITWCFSMYLEAVAILPQLYMICKTEKCPKWLLYYLISLVLYRCFYIINWIYRYLNEGFYDLISIVCGVLQAYIYVDFFFTLPLTAFICDKFSIKRINLAKSYYDSSVINIEENAITGSVTLQMEPVQLKETTMLHVETKEPSADTVIGSSK